MEKWKPLEMRHKNLKALLDQWCEVLNGHQPEQLKIKEVCYWPQGIKYALLDMQAAKLGEAERAIFCAGSKWAMQRMERQLSVAELIAFRSCLVKSFLTDSFFYIEA